ncbi:MAG: hypothetical protein PHC89_00610 [Candidatus Pacebacteria bacterium]|nr:hypothetical protein [Candidatus Paceibacterota bacterium]
MSENTTHWITRLIPILAFAAGIIISSVGGIMLISSSLKLAFFQEDPYSYFTEQECVYPYSKLTPQPLSETERAGEIVEQNPEEIQSCIKRNREQQRYQFKNRHQQNIIDALSALVVGGILLAIFRKRNK